MNNLDVDILYFPGQEGALMCLLVLKIARKLTSLLKVTKYPWEKFIGHSLGSYIRLCIFSSEADYYLETGLKIASKAQMGVQGWPLCSPVLVSHLTSHKQMSHSKSWTKVTLLINSLPQDYF